MGLGDTIASVTGLDSLAGNYSGSSLQGFLNKYNDSEGLYANTIDTLHTFDVDFAFWPKFAQGEPKKELIDKIIDAGIGAIKSTAMSIGNNITGGLLGSILRDLNGKSLKDLQSTFIGENSGQDQTSFVDYLSRGNLINDSDSAQKPQLIIDFSYYVQNMTLPQIIMKDGENIETLVGEFPTNGRYVKPSQNSFQMTVINTKAPLIERIFYPWMREVTLPFWSYNQQPYTTADVTVRFDKHTDMQYVFVGSRPSNIEALQPSQDLQTPTRTVSFVFDYMFVTSTLKTYETTGQKLLGLGKSVLNDVGGTLGF